MKNNDKNNKDSRDEQKIMSSKMKKKVVESSSDTESNSSIEVIKKQAKKTVLKKKKVVESSSDTDVFSSDSEEEIKPVKKKLLKSSIVENNNKKNSNIKKVNNKQIKFIEVCSGAGGLSSGFINENFEPILLNDNDKTCCDTLEKNHPDTKVIRGSFVDIDYKKYENVDVFMGGIPCQSWSQSGKREGLDDPRGQLLPEFIKLINKVAPKVFLIENVKGLTTHDDGKTFKQIIKSIEDLKKYKISYKVLNSNDYGVAQKRERLIIIGVHNNIKKEFVFPEKDEKKLVLKDVLKNVPESSGYTYSEDKKKIMDLVPPGGCWVNLPVDIQKKYMKKSYESGGGKRGIARRLSMNEPSLTLTTSPCQKQTERCHPIETRPLNIREYARIQSFSDNYVFTGSIAKQYKQIGNAVPVKLAERIARSIKDLLK